MTFLQLFMLEGSILGCVGAILEGLAGLLVSTMGFIKHEKWKCLIAHRFCMFLNMRFGCRSLILGYVGAIFGLSWADLGQFGATLGLCCAASCCIGVIIGKLGGDFGQPWAS